MKNLILVLASLMLLAPVSLLAGKGDVADKEKSKEEKKVQVVVTEIPEDAAQDVKEEIKEETNEANKEDIIIREINKH